MLFVVLTSIFCLGFFGFWELLLDGFLDFFNIYCGFLPDLEHLGLEIVGFLVF